jgi:hypothetical protein
MSSVKGRMQEFEVYEGSPCYTCAHKLAPFSCKAFNQIPMIFVTGENDHKKPYKGDHGFQWKAQKKAPRLNGAFSYQ